MQDKPAAEDLLEALAVFLDTRVVPAFTGRDRFHALVSSNVARMVAREIRLGPTQSRGEYETLCGLLEKAPSPEGGSSEDLLGLTAELVQRIERGDADSGEYQQRVTTFLREVVRDKLAVANPKVLEKD
jgi:hypothetical protein